MKHKHAKETERNNGMNYQLFTIVCVASLREKAIKKENVKNLGSLVLFKTIKYKVKFLEHKLCSSIDTFEYFNIKVSPAPHLKKSIIMKPFLNRSG